MARESTILASYLREVRMPICRGTLGLTDRYQGQAVTYVASSADNRVFPDLRLRASVILSEGLPHKILLLFCKAEED